MNSSKRSVTEARKVLLYIITRCDSHQESLRLIHSKTVETLVLSLTYLKD